MQDLVTGTLSIGNARLCLEDGLKAEVKCLQDFFLLPRLIFAAARGFSSMRHFRSSLPEDEVFDDLYYSENGLEGVR